MNHALDVSVEDWQSDGSDAGSSRTVRFTLPMELPAIVKKALGVDAIPVTEQQHLAYADNGDFTVECASCSLQQARILVSGSALLVCRSRPTVGIPMGSSYTTTSCIRVSTCSDLPSTSCRVSACLPGCTLCQQLSCAQLLMQPVHGKVAAEAECSAAGPWGMIGMIEGIMASEATQSISRFLNYCAAECSSIRFHPVRPASVMLSSSRQESEGC